MRAILVHGIGSRSSWWKPVFPGLESLGIEPVAPDMPPPDVEGGEAWVKEVISHVTDVPTILAGHSLGAAACIQAALRCKVEGLILLACPPFFPDFAPPAPNVEGVSPKTMALVARFLRQASDMAGQVKTDSVHFVGDNDYFVPVEQARRLPFPVVVVPSADHDLNRSLAFRNSLMEYLSTTTYGRRYLDPGVRYRHISRASTSPIAELGLENEAPHPSRLDLEITTRCQLKCPLCARTLYRDAIRERDMEPVVFEKILDELEYVRELFFVGLGEPLLHPGLGTFVEQASNRSVKTKLVTNGLLATADTLAGLRDKGLSEVTFSIDTTVSERFQKLRGGASLDTVLGNFRSVPDGLKKSIFVTLSRENAGDLKGIIDLAVEAGLAAVAVTDTNFEENLDRSLNTARIDEKLAEAIQYSKEKHVLLISPHFHDLDACRDSFMRCRARKPSDITSRCRMHTHCLAPWRIAVIGAGGEVTPCNCAPKDVMGNVTTERFDGVWNGEAMRRWRSVMRSAQNRACLACPRY